MNIALECDDCPIGWTSKSGQDKCTMCEPGSTPNTESTSCDTCELGRHGPSNTECLDCRAGTYQDARGQIKCEECPVDTYGTKPKATSKAECEACKSDRTTSNATAQSLETSCICTATLYYTNAKNECEECMNGADCSDHDGILLNELHALNGYWRPTAQSTTFADCSKGYSTLDAKELAEARCCPLGQCNHTNVTTTASSKDGARFEHPDEQCYEGYAGPLCLSCATDYVKMGISCSKCEGGAKFVLAFLPLLSLSLVVCVAALLFMICGKKKVEDDANDVSENAETWFGQIKIALSFVQVFGSMSSVLNGVPWPATFLSFSLPLQAFNLDFLSLLSYSTCQVAVRFFDMFILHMILPFVLLFALIGAYAIARCLVKSDAKKKQIKALLFKMIILVILFLFPGLAQKIFTVFKCVKIDGIAKILLEKDVSVVCHVGEHLTYTAIAVGFMMLYIVGKYKYIQTRRKNIFSSKVFSTF